MLTQSTLIVIAIAVTVSIVTSIAARYLWGVPVNKLAALTVSLLLALAFSLVNRLFLQDIEVDSVIIIFVMTLSFIVISQIRPLGEQS